MVNIINTASELGYIQIPDNTLISIEQMKNYPDEQIVMITTGSQGEPMSALYRMAYGDHSQIKSASNPEILLFSAQVRYRVMKRQFIK